MYDIDDNCPIDANADQEDCDGDGEGDVCELIDGTQGDEDGDGIPDDCEDLDCPADFTGDSTVDIEDLLVLLGQFGSCTDECSADIDGNGAVDIDDLLNMMGSWGVCG